MKEWGRIGFFALLIAGMLSVAVLAHAQEQNAWTEEIASTRMYGAVERIPMVEVEYGIPYFDEVPSFNQAYNYEYYSVDYRQPLESPHEHHTKVVKVISKSASIWQEPRTNSKRIGTAKNGQEVEIIRGDYGGPLEQNGFYRVSFNGKAGWINSDYCVYAPLEIVLMESNVPAYCAPDRNSKKVGSLSKLTRYTVLGTCADYYIVNLRQAAAFIPMDVAHYDSVFEGYFVFPDVYTFDGVVLNKTTLRTGPGDWYTSVEDVKPGYEFDCVGEIDGWYVMIYDGTDGEVLVYLPAYDAQVDGFYLESNG